MKLRSLALGLTVAAVALGTPTVAADTNSGPAEVVPYYVALGDSYTAAPFASRPVGQYNNDRNPYGCGKVDQNYPRLMARHLGLFDPLATPDLGAGTGLLQVGNPPGFIDISCGSARTKHMTEAQTGLPTGEDNHAQFDAFDWVAEVAGNVTLVTVGIGGNDLGFGELQDYCVQPPEEVGGTPCRVHYENVDGVGDPAIEGDIIEHRLGLLESRLARVLVGDSETDGIAQLAPAAEVLIFGYPALLPEYQDGCYPYIPILPTDAAYLRNAEKKLNRLIRQTAEAYGAHYVDWYSPSIGHDMCAPPGMAWTNGVVLAPPSFPVHPNLLGAQGAANAGIGVLDAIEFDFAAGRG